MANDSEPVTIRSEEAVFTSNPNVVPVHIDGVGWLMRGPELIMFSLFAPYANGERQRLENREAARFAMTPRGFKNMLDYFEKHKNALLAEPSAVEK